MSINNFVYICHNLPANYHFEIWWFWLINQKGNSIMNACNQTSYTSQNKPGICKSEEPIRETNIVVFQGYIVWKMMLSCLMEEHA